MAPETADPDVTMKLSRTARTLLSVTALAWSIPFAQADDVTRGDAEETVVVRPLPARAGTPAAAAGPTEQAREPAKRD